MRLLFLSLVLFVVRLVRIGSVFDEGFAAFQNIWPINSKELVMPDSRVYIVETAVENLLHIHVQRHDGDIALSLK